MRVHPAAEIFPAMSADEFAALKVDIAAHGVLEPIWVMSLAEPLEGEIEVILDGRHRAKACEELGIYCPSEEYDGDDPVGFVVSLNLKRRHLQSGQLAFVALEIEKVEAAIAKERMAAGGGDQKSGTAILPDPIAGTGEAREKAGATVGVSARYVSDAKKLAAGELLKPL